MSPHGREKFQGLLVGRRSTKWRVAVTVVDEMLGPVAGNPTGPVIHVFSDPLDLRIDQAVSRRELVWGWTEGTLGLWNDDLEHDTPDSAPFSVANSRLKAIADGVELTVCVCRNEEAEHALKRLREDLAILVRSVGPSPAHHLEMGLRVAWGHTSTLASLPCEPSWYDRFAGIPPRAARATDTFEKELGAWAKTLDGATGEYASIVASDVADLRAALDKGNPFVTVLKSSAGSGTSTLAILRSKTAARALISRLGGDPTAETFGSLRTTWLAALHDLPSWESAIVTGAPPRSVWHRIDSGIPRDVRLLVLGDDEARRIRWAIRELKMAREKWGSLSLRETAWRELVGGAPPPPPLDVPFVPVGVASVAGPTAGAEVDPFSPLGSLLRDDRPLTLDEGTEEWVARPDSGGSWRATVNAVEVRTDIGRLLLPEDDEVDVLEDEPTTHTASTLVPGMRIVIGRQSGRIGLIEALEDKLKHRPDLLAARMVVKDYQERVYSSFAASGLALSVFHARLKALGCNKHEVTMRAWVTPGGPMAPRDLEDLLLVIQVLGLDLLRARVREISASLERIRTFRRVAGRALARAATEAVLGPEDSKVDPATGLSIADLQEAVVIAKILSIKRLDTPVRLAETGRLEKEAA